MFPPHTHRFEFQFLPGRETEEGKGEEGGRGREEGGRGYTEEGGRDSKGSNGLLHVGQLNIGTIVCAAFPFRPNRALIEFVAVCFYLALLTRIREVGGREGVGGGQTRCTCQPRAVQKRYNQ